MAINIQRFVSEISRRGGETTIDHMPYGRAGWKHVQERELEPVNKERVTEPAGSRRTLYLLHCEGWRYYSRGFGSRKASLSYLCGVDDNGPWAVRVPGTIETVGEPAFAAISTGAAEINSSSNATLIPHLQLDEPLSRRDRTGCDQIRYGRLPVQPRPLSRVVQTKA